LPQHGLGLLVIHTREGHRPDLADAPPAKLARGPEGARIGDPGPMGRILIRGEPGHDIIAELAPAAGEPVIDKPGKGAFYQTDLDLMLRNRGIDTLFVAGVTTEVCVHTTIREANDRGYRCVALADCCASYFPEFHRIALDMIKAQGSKGGIFGWVAETSALIDALAACAPHDANFSCEGGMTDGVDISFKLRLLAGSRCGPRATGTPFSASAPTCWSICWCSPGC
jgi:biuret amidohydrolase